MKQQIASRSKAKSLCFSIGIVFFVVSVMFCLPLRADQGPAEWKAGIATAVITPDEPMWMAGYAGRDKPSEGKIHDLYAKVLALQDAQGAIPSTACQRSRFNKAINTWTGFRRQYSN